MSQENSILNLLNIQDPNIEISGCTDAVEGALHTKELTGVLSYRVERCRFCKSTNVVKNGKRPTKLKLPSLSEQPLRFRLYKQRYFCRECHRTFSAKTELTQRNRSISLRARQVIHSLAKEAIPVKKIAKIVGVSASSVQRILYANKTAYVTPHGLPKALCFDEFRSTGGRFSFICIDAKTHDLLLLLENRLSKTIKEYFLNNYSLAQRQKVQVITMDLNAQYQQFVHYLFPNAIIVFDRFHIVQLASRALDQARIKAFKEISDPSHSRIYKALKKQWKLFHADEKALNNSEIKYYSGLNEYTTAQNIVDLGLDAFPVFKKAYAAYQAVLHVIRGRDRAALQKLVLTYKNSNTEMDTVIKTIKDNYAGIRNACLYNYSNGPLEGFNRKIKELKRGCYGFRNLHHFFVRIQLIA